MGTAARVRDVLAALRMRPAGEGDGGPLARPRRPPLAAAAEGLPPAEHARRAAALLELLDAQQAPRRGR